MRDASRGDQSRGQCQQDPRQGSAVRRRHQLPLGEGEGVTLVVVVVVVVGVGTGVLGLDRKKIRKITTARIAKSTAVLTIRCRC